MKLLIITMHSLSLSWPPRRLPPAEASAVRISFTWRRAHLLHLGTSAVLLHGFLLSQTLLFGTQNNDFIERVW